MPENTYRRSIEKRRRQIDEARAVLDGITDAWLYELFRRREIVSGDGFGSGVGGGGTENEYSSTESAAINALDRPGCMRPLYVKIAKQKRLICKRCGFHSDEHVADAVGSTVEAILDLLDSATQSARSIPRLYETVINASDGRTGRQTSLTDCLACHKPVTGIGNDRIRSGYCMACYMAWRRFVTTNGPEASHVIFRQNRTAEGAA